MGKSLAFAPGCEWTVKSGVLFVDYESMTGEHVRARFYLSPETEYIIDGYKLETLHNIYEHSDDFFIQKVEYYEIENHMLIGGKMLVPTKVYFEAKAKKTAEETRDKFLRQVANSAYGIASRDWADVLADSARYIHTQQSRRNGKTLWLSSAAISDDPLRMLREEYLKAIGREEDEKLGRWLRIPEFISDDLEECEKGVPNTKLIDPQLYIQCTTTGEMKPYEGVKNITPAYPNGYFDTNMVMTREEMEYCLNDVAVTEKLFKEERIMRFDSCKPTIKNVIFNDPETIVMWSDGTKTVVKCGENDTFDPEKGVAMCCMKKLLGTNKTGSNYLDKVQEYFDSYIEETVNNVVIGEILGSIFGSKKKPSNSKDIPPEVTVEKEFEAVTSSDWEVVPADENTIAEENGE